MEESDNISKKKRVAEAIIINQELVQEASHTTTGGRYQLQSSMNEEDKEATHNINESGGMNDQNEADDALANKEATGRRYQLQSSMNEEDKEVAHNINESGGMNAQNEADDALANEEAIGRRYQLQSSMNEEDKEATHNINESGGMNAQNEADDALANEEGVDARSSQTLNIEYCRNKGLTRCAIELNNIDKVEIICDLNGHPIGESSTKFASYLEMIVREIVPITHADWRAIPVEVKNQLWTLVTQNYIVSNAMKIWVFASMDKQWCDHKHQLVKNHYDKYDNDADRIANPPHCVSQKDWEAFVNGRSNTDFKAMVQRNKRNRSHQSVMYTYSRRKYARLEYEMRKSQPNAETPLPRTTMCMTAHKKKDGAHFSTKVAKTIKKMDDALSSPNFINQSIKDDVLTKVLGLKRSCQVQGDDKGVLLSALFAGESYIQKLDQMEEKLVDNAKKLEEKLVEKDKKIEEILTRLSQIEAKSLHATLAIGHNISGSVQGTRINSIPSRSESSMGLKIDHAN